MKITDIETIEMKEHPNFFFVVVYTDEGIEGLGQTADPERTIPVVHEFGRMLIGREAMPEPIWDDLFEAASFHGYAGAEIRAISAIDIALWDILGQKAGLPIYALLGGACRDRIWVYNSCSVYREYSDAQRVLDEPVALAEELLERGMTAMKIWVLDTDADQNRGQFITAKAVQQAIEPARKIDNALGNEMLVAIEGHARWNLVSAKALVHALSEFSNILWVEDLIGADHAENWAALREVARMPVCGSERLFTRFQFRRFIETGATDILMADITWCGGISELKKLATLAEVHQIPVAPHDHSGPVNQIATAHVLANIPNTMICESTRVFYNTYYANLVEPSIVIEKGHMLRPEGPGLGTELKPDVRTRPDAVIRGTTVRA
ncbi:MAG: mandelate racemase/muconate lactonizing enzyme family protein [Candidatus Latescibacteria bacterium]|nr:mandelate racemase/muconate lactonizing enzyme family protein [Candidatus Latescibacterota bacterium]